MPRGVYDRSKMKKKATKSTEAVVHTAPAAHKKTGPKGPRGRKAKGTGANITSAAPLSAGRVGGEAIFLVDQVRQNLNTLVSLKQQFSDISTIRTEVEAHLEVMSDLRKQLFGAQDKAEVAAQAQSNGVTGTTSMPSTVPMPPSIPVIPTTH